MARTKWVFRSCRLGVLEYFLERVTADAVNELDRIQQRCTAGEFHTFEEYESAESLPYSSVEIASRAIAQELVNLVEGELQAAAYIPWHHSNHKGPKTLFDLQNYEEATKLNQVSDLNIQKVIGLIETHYGIALDQVDGWDEVNRLRHIVNAFKHRDGMKRLSECTSLGKGFIFPQREKFNSVQATTAIRSVKRFFVALDQTLKAAGNSHHPPPTSADG
jgi:hypothetical protein